jgi:hypothetical protein
MSRLSTVPVLALPSEGLALERWARGNISAVVAAVDTTLASALRCEPAWLSRLNTTLV